MWQTRQVILQVMSDPGACACVAFPARMGHNAALPEAACPALRERSAVRR